MAGKNFFYWEHVADRWVSCQSSTSQAWSVSRNKNRRMNKRTVRSVKGSQPPRNLEVSAQGVKFPDVLMINNNSWIIPGVTFFSPCPSAPGPDDATTMTASQTRRSTEGGCLTWRRRSAASASALPGWLTWRGKVGGAPGSLLLEGNHLIYKVWIMMMIINKITVTLSFLSLSRSRLHLWVRPERRTEGARRFPAAWWTWNTVGLGFSFHFTRPQMRYCSNPALTLKFFPS